MTSKETEQRLREALETAQTALRYYADSEEGAAVAVVALLDIDKALNG